MIKNNSRKESFLNAIEGLCSSFRTEGNLKIMGFAGLAVLALSFWLGLSAWEWIAIIWAIFAVIGVEMINSSLEAITDLVEEKWHQKAKQAKDVASGMVLLAVIGALLIGALVFLPKFTAFFN